MKFIFAESNSFDPYFNLSFEKYLFDNVKEGEIIFFLWQNEKTIVLGRHQNVYKECNVTALNSIGGKIARRLSGGGAVFHDKGNLNFTIIARDEDFDVERQLNIVINALKTFNINAEASGRNDLTIDGKKFSGSAFRKANGVSAHHGTLMLNVDTSILETVLNVDKEKLKAHGVASVSSRTINLCELSKDINVDSMKEALKKTFLLEYDKDCFDEILIVGGKDVIKGNGKTDWSWAGSMLTMLKNLSETQEFLKSEEWIFGKNKDFTSTIENRFMWGDISLNFVIDGNIIKDITIFSDCLFPSFIEELESALIGKRYNYQDIKDAIDCSTKKFDDIGASIGEDIKELLKQNI